MRATKTYGSVEMEEVMGVVKRHHSASRHCISYMSGRDEGIMRTLEDIFTAVPCTRTILFEDGEWCIYRRQYGSLTETNYVIHRCQNVDKACEENYFICGGENTIGGCGEEAPLSIKTLYIIHTWER